MTIQSSQSPYRKLLFLASISALVGRSYAWGSSCYYDAYGNEQCNGLAYGARVGIAIAILALLLVLLLGTFYARKRRIARYQQAALANGRLGAQPTTAQNYYGGGAGFPQQQQQQYGYAAPGVGAGGVGNGQYYEQLSQTYNYGPAAESWQPPPPKYEPPPPGSNPVKNDTTAQMSAEEREWEQHRQQQEQEQGRNLTGQTTMYAPPAGAPPQPGNDNRV